MACPGRIDPASPVHIDWVRFSPWTSLAGGVLIGLACALLLLANGRIAGVSGIVRELLRAGAGASGWRLAFVAGVFLAPALCRALPAEMLPAPPGMVDGVRQLVPFALGGVLVGIGSRMANGCTSGHGICGLARRSRRSLAAVAVFMATAILVVFLVRHVAGWGT